MKVRASINQVIDGKAYKGSLDFGLVKLLYEIDFTIPIPQIKNEMKKFGEQKVTCEELRRMFQIWIFDLNGKQIKISNDEYGSIFPFLLEFTISFYWSPQTRQKNAILTNQISLLNIPHFAAGSYDEDICTAFVFNLGPNKILEKLVLNSRYRSFH